MRQNIIEIILDTSKSMGKEIFPSSEVTKFDLAKEMLLNFFIEWRTHECNNLLFIRYYHNSEIVTIKNIDRVKRVDAKENKPIFKVIENSIENLDSFDETYKNKIIIILTDGQNNYNIETKKINPKIKIYSMEIGGTQRVENQKLQSLSIETKGVSYSIFIKNDNEKDMERMYSKIKKYFKCFKFPSRRLVFILSLVLLFPFVSPFFKSCKSIALPPITGCNRQSDIPIFIKEDSNITHCEEDIINNIRLKKCTLISNKLVEAIIYTHGSFKVISLKNFASAKSNIDENYKKFLQEILEKRLNINSIEKIQIFGHTDLEKVSENKLYYFNKNCIPIYHVNKNTNECLGNERAFQVKKIISETKYKKNPILAQYDNDFFMRRVDKKLGGTLLKALNLNEDIDFLMQKLNIEKNYDINKTRKNDRIQQKIQDNKRLYIEKFQPFRNVIIVIEMKKRAKS
jgi:hypothetical protein